MQVAVVSALSLLLGCTPRHPEAPPSLADITDAALPGVVLLVRQLPDNKTGYGAGLLLNEQGTVLTNLHVAANATALGALLYDPERTSYTRLDGGLLRYLFENDDDVVPALQIQRPGDDVLPVARREEHTDLGLGRADERRKPLTDAIGLL